MRETAGKLKAPGSKIRILAAEFDRMADDAASGVSHDSAIKLGLCDEDESPPDADAQLTTSDEGIIWCAYQ